MPFHPGWMPASQLTRRPSCQSSPCGSHDPGAKSTVIRSWPVLPSYLFRPARPSAYVVLLLPVTHQMLLSLSKHTSCSLGLSSELTRMSTSGTHVFGSTRRMPPRRNAAIQSLPSCHFTPCVPP